MAELFLAKSRSTINVSGNEEYTLFKEIACVYNIVQQKLVGIAPVQQLKRPSPPFQLKRIHQLKKK